MRNHSPEELEKASDYLELILHMAEEDMRVLLRMPRRSFGRNVYIDSVLIRLRSIIEFLCSSDTSWDTDVIARHYIGDFSLPDPDCAWLRNEKKQIDTTLAHLTIAPMPKLISEVEFPYREIYCRVMMGLKAFFDADPPNVLEQAKERFTSAYKLAQRLADTTAA